MTDYGSYDPELYHANAAKEVERLRFQHMLSWDKEVRVLERLGLSGAKTILDAGCGPGFAMVELLDRYPDTTLTGLDANPHFISEAKTSLQDHDDHRYTLMHADIYQTGLKPRSFDFIVARCIFQHLKRPRRAIRELYRALKPGGTLVITDVDDAFGTVTEPPLVELKTASNQLSSGQDARGGNRFIGRWLCRLLKDVGTEDVTVDCVVNHSDEVGLSLFRHQLDGDRFAPMRQAGELTPSQYSSAKSGLDRFLSNPDAMVMTALLVCSGKRPVDSISG